MKVLLLHRAKNFGYSFEELFSSIKNNFTNCKVEEFYDKTHPSFFKNVKALRRIKCDVIHITGGVGYYALFLPSRKTILTVHDTNHYEFDLKGIKKWLFGWIIYKLPIMNVKYVTVVSEHTKRNLVRFFKINEAKIKVIPNCYPDNFIPQIAGELSSPVKMLQIGTKPNKNIRNLLLAISGLNIELTIIGKLNNELKELIDQSDNTFVCKKNLTIEEVYQEYVNCDIVAFVSLREGFGLPIIEANRVGRPVISSNISSMPEVAGNSACLVNPKDTDEIRNGIIRLINEEDYRKKLVKNGFENAKKYSPEIIAGYYQKLYSEIIN